MSGLSCFQKNSNTNGGSHKSVNHTEECFKRMCYFFITDQLTNVTLKAGDTSLKVHKVVLASVSEYFLAMFNCNMIESRAEVVELHEVDAQALRALVSYAYSGKVELKQETVESILAAAVLLRFTEVVDVCTDFVASQLDPSNCVGIALFADSRNCQQLRDAAISFAEEHFVQVIQNEEFLMLQADDLATLLSSEGLNAPSEEVVYKSLIKWTDHDVEIRSQHLKTLLELVKLPLLPPQLLVEELVPRVGTSAMVTEALSYHALPQRLTSFPKNRVTPRPSSTGRLCFVAGCERSKGTLTCSCTVREYSPRLDEWSTLAQMSTHRQQLGVAAMGCHIVLAGGKDGLRTINCAQYLNLGNGRWTNIEPMSSARHGLCLVGCGGKGPIFAIGGHNGWNFLNSVERWDPVTDQWTVVQALTSPRSALAGAYLHRRLFIVGGRNGVSSLNTVEAFDPLAGKWMPCAPMSLRRGGLAVVVLDGLLYALGGYDTVDKYSSVERYDPRTDCWQDVAPMSVGRMGLGAATLGNKIFAIGGYDGESYLTVVEEYDPFSDTWTMATPLKVGCLGWCVVCDRL